MLCVVEDKEYDLPEEIVYLVNEAKTYKMVLGGLSPLETSQYMSEIASNLRDIKKLLNIVE